MPRHHLPADPPAFRSILVTAGSVLTAVGVVAVLIAWLADSVHPILGLIVLVIFVVSVLGIFAGVRLAVVAAGGVGTAVVTAIPFVLITGMGLPLCLVGRNPISGWWIVGADVAVYTLWGMYSAFVSSEGYVPVSSEEQDVEAAPGHTVLLDELPLPPRYGETPAPCEQVLARSVTSVAYEGEELASAADAATLRGIAAAHPRSLRAMADVLAVRLDLEKDKTGEE
ncbi:uncharacterized protein LOC62_07G008981 [Vanrija pseudolonga]|uniref:Uncharacterized protein n=1 Tax=Vanrija pseudolonga TaxID=143232 RepID=A0AAF1BLU5_9TREE|nr:hypothetical protein LOC62_07G008981 [Vanrija pseudolonga]